MTVCVRSTLRGSISYCCFVEVHRTPLPNFRLERFQHMTVLGPYMSHLLSILQNYPFGNHI